MIGVKTRHTKSARSGSRTKRNRLRNELLEPRLLLAAGDPDLSFGLDGAVSVQVVQGEHRLKPAAIVSSPGDKTVLVYETFSGFSRVSSRTLIAARG